MEQGRRRGSGTFGWLLFALIFVVPQLARPLSNWLAQSFGLNVSPGTIAAAAIGLYVLSTLLGPAMRSLGRGRAAGDSRLPTPAAPPAPLAPPRPGSTPAPPARLPAPPARPGAGPALRTPDSPSPLPGPPRFEPIVDPRVLTCGIVGLLALGAFLLILFFFAGSLP